MAEIGVLLLAGGRSRRMGADKASLNWQGVSLLEWQQRRLNPVGEVLVSGPAGITDGFTDSRGPLAGLLAACKARPDIRFWVLVPVDMPLIRTDRLSQLLTLVEKVAVPVAYKGYPLPMAVPVSKALVAQLNVALSDPDGPRSLRWLHQSHQGQWLELAPPESEMINMNTPEQWQQARAHLGEIHEQAQQQ